MAREPELSQFRLTQLEASASEAAATGSTPGTMSATDKAKLDLYASTWAANTAASPTVAGLMAAQDKANLAGGFVELQARGAVASNVATLSAFVVSQDGITYAQGDRVLLVAQSTAAQNGLYIVGVVAGTAPLTRDLSMPVGAAFVNGQIVQVSEGTLYAGSSWKAMCTGAKIVGTDDPLFYPRKCGGTLTLASGTKTLGSADGLWLFSTTTCPIICSLNTPGGTLTTTIGYHSAVANRTAGKAGTAAAIVIAHLAAGSIQNADNSTVDWLVTNW